MTRHERFLRNKRILERFEAGATTKDIAFEFSITRESAYRIVGRRVGEKRIERYRKAMEMHAAGASYRDIGRAVGCSRGSAWCLINYKRKVI